LSNEFKEEVSVPTYKEKLVLGLSDREWIRSCYKAYKDSRCFRECNGHSLCVLCPKRGRNEEKAEESTQDKKQIVKGLDLELPEKKSVPKIPIVEIDENISEIAEKAGVSKKTQKLAKEILHQAKEKNIPIGGRSPRGFAAAISRIACQQVNEGKSIKEIADAAGVSQSTVSNNCWYLRLKLKLPKGKRRRHKRAN
jgi:hypothetical protein